MNTRDVNPKSQEALLVWQLADSANGYTYVWKLFAGEPAVLTV